jgi:Na+-translocating ferredoxin:NAD+ oxidoreductase RnfG subunit
VYFSKEQNSYGTVDVLVGIDVSGVIKQVVISSSTNTPNFVKKIEQNYLEPFMSQAVNDVEFDASTGATYTYTSVSAAVTKAADFFASERSDLDD